MRATRRTSGLAPPGSPEIARVSRARPCASMQRMSRRSGLALAAGVIAFAAITTLVGIASGAPLDFLVLDLVTGLTFVVAGIAAVWLRPASPAGPMLLVSGALWYVGSYGPSGQPVVTNLGFAFEGYYDLVLAALAARAFLTGPARPTAMAGRGARRGDGGAVAGPAAPARLRRLPAQPVRGLAGPGSVRGGRDRLQPRDDRAVRPRRRSSALRRLLRSGPVWRRVRWPILVAGGLAMGVAAFDAFENAWTTATQQPLVALPEPWDAVFSWTLFGVRTFVPIAFLIATLRIRSAPGPLGPFAAGLERPGGAGTVGDAIRTALGDRSLVLMRAAGPGTWIGEDGAHAVVAPSRGGPRGDARRTRGRAARGASSTIPRCSSSPSCSRRSSASSGSPSRTSAWNPSFASSSRRSRSRANGS